MSTFPKSKNDTEFEIVSCQRQSLTNECKRPINIEHSNLVLLMQCNKLLQDITVAAANGEKKLPY